MTVKSYSVPKAAESFLLEGILHNPLLCHNIPTDAAALAKYMKSMTSPAYLLTGDSPKAFPPSKVWSLCGQMHS